MLFLCTINIFFSDLRVRRAKERCLWEAWRVTVLVACDLLISVKAYTPLCSCAAHWSWWFHYICLQNNKMVSVYMYELCILIIPTTACGTSEWNQKKSTFRHESCASMRSSCKSIFPIPRIASTNNYPHDAVAKMNKNVVSCTLSGGIHSVYDVVWMLHEKYLF